jgi:hypothetical protein
MASKTSAGAATASVADSHETIEADGRGIEKSPAAVLARFSGLVKPRWRGHVAARPLRRGQNRACTLTLGLDLAMVVTFIRAEGLKRRAKTGLLPKRK